MKSVIALLICGSFATFSALARQIRVTPEMDLNNVQWHYADATNLTSRGMFREAEYRIKWGDEIAVRRLKELDERMATVEPLQTFIGRLQVIRNHFEENWTNAVLEALFLEDPLKGFVVSNQVIKRRLDGQMNNFKFLRKELEEGNKRDAGTTLWTLQYMLEDQLSAFEAVKRCASGFRDARTDFESARKNLMVERSKPLDAERALRIAWDYYAETTNRIAGSDGAFAGADTPRNAARAYLEDIRQVGVLTEEVETLSKALDATERDADITAIRYYMGQAKEGLKKQNPMMAQSNVRIAECYLQQLGNDPVVSEFGSALKDLQTSAEQMFAEQKLARNKAELERLRTRPGFADAPVLGANIAEPDGMSETDRERFVAETDFAAILKHEASFDNLDVSVSRGQEGTWFCSPNDPDFSHKIRSAFRESFNTNFPVSVTKKECFQILLFYPTKEYGTYYAREWTDGDGRLVREILPCVRVLNVIRISEMPDDLFLYFSEANRNLLKPGARTALIPGLGAYLDKKLPK